MASKPHSGTCRGARGDRCKANVIDGQRRPGLLSSTARKPTLGRTHPVPERGFVAIFGLISRMVIRTRFGGEVAGALRHENSLELARIASCAWVWEGFELPVGRRGLAMWRNADESTACASGGSAIRAEPMHKMGSAPIRAGSRVGLPWTCRRCAPKRAFRCAIGWVLRRYRFLRMWRSCVSSESAAAPVQRRSV